MTTQEKAQELVKKYLTYFPEFYHDEMSYDYNEDRAKECAIIAVDEILNDDWYITTLEDLAERRKYWKAVKEEINNL